MYNDNIPGYTRYNSLQNLQTPIVTLESLRAPSIKSIKSNKSKVSAKAIKKIIDNKMKKERKENNFVLKKDDTEGLKERIKNLNLNKEEDEEDVEKRDLLDIASNVSMEGQIIADIKNTISNMLKKPLTMIVMVVAIVVVVTHSSGLDKGFLKEFLTTYKDNSMVIWLNDTKNFEKFLGFVVYIPAVLDMQSEYRPGVMCLVGLWLFIMPNMGIFEYFAQAVILHTFMKVRLSTSRVFLVAASIVCFVFGVLTFKAKVITPPKR